MRRWTVYILCTMGLLAVSARGEGQTPAFVDADGDGINDAYQGMHRARGRMRGAGKGDWLTVLSKVKLTEEQRARLKQASLDYQKAVSPLNATFDAAQVKLRETMLAAPPDPNAINTQIDAVNTLRAQLQKAAAAYQIAIQGILTPEQWAALNVAARDPGGGGPALRGARKGGEDVFIDADGDGICDGRGVGRRPPPPIKRGPRERGEP
jgi:Spy/CpxP family protein refolding chaperone